MHVMSAMQRRLTSHTNALFPTVLSFLGVLGGTQRLGLSVWKPFMGSGDYNKMEHQTLLLQDAASAAQASSEIWIMQRCSWNFRRQSAVWFECLVCFQSA
jgi:hypothetical protein